MPKKLSQEQWYKHWLKEQNLMYTRLAVQAFEDWNSGHTVSRLENLVSSFAAPLPWLTEFVSAAKDFFQSGAALTEVKRIEDAVGTESFRPIYCEYLLALETQCSFRPHGPEDHRFTEPRLDLKLDFCHQPQIYSRERGKEIPLRYFGARVQTKLMEFVAEQLQQHPKSGLNCDNIPDNTYVTLAKALHFSLPVAYTFGGNSCFKVEPAQEGFVFYHLKNQK